MSVVDLNERGCPLTGIVPLARKPMKESLLLLYTPNTTPFAIPKWISCIVKHIDACHPQELLASMTQASAAGDIARHRLTHSVLHQCAEHS